MTTDDFRFRLSDGRTFAGLAFGEPAGKPVFYFHGCPGSRLESRFALPAVEKFGLRLVAPDRPGFGGSTFKPGRTIGAWADDIVELADHFGFDRFAMIGVSGGGPYALACAARIPQRLHRVSLVAAIGPLARKQLTEGMVAVNRRTLALAKRWPSAAQLLVRLAAIWVRRHPEHCISAMSAGAAAADLAVLAVPAHRQLLAESMAEAVRQGGRGVAWDISLMARPWDFDLSGIDLPVRLWHGLADTIVPPAMARYLVEALPHGECHYLPEEGHMSLIVRHLDDVFADLCG